MERRVRNVDSFFALPAVPTTIRFLLPSTQQLYELWFFLHRAESLRPCQSFANLSVVQNNKTVVILLRSITILRVYKHFI